jgi:hypothetical protein
MNPFEPQPMPYRGWDIYGHGDSWVATRFGVSMTANSYELLRTMIYLKLKDEEARKTTPWPSLSNE